jgi:hypothetical protein
MKADNVSERLDPEWVTLNAVRDLMRLAVRGDNSKSTYDNALALGAAICPEILGPDVSVLRQDRESDLTKEYRQRATLRTIRDGNEITALSLVKNDIDEFESLLSAAKASKDKTKTDQLQRKLKKFYSSEEEINPDKNSENQLIFRDALKVNRNIPMLIEGKNNRTFELFDNNLLTIRVLHPEIPEHITGADHVYERYDAFTNTVVIAFVQYKIWENKMMYFSDNDSNKRMLGQIEKMQDFLCRKDICKNENNNQYRFPGCSAFLRPTDKLQSPNQAFISTGEHLPICHINNCISTTLNGARVLEYSNVKKISLSNEIFEELFSQGKIGSPPLSLEKLADLYKNSYIISKKDTMLLYAQEYPK